jgi:hypothetical protein
MGRRSRKARPSAKRPSSLNKLTGRLKRLKKSLMLTSSGKPARNPLRSWLPQHNWIKMDCKCPSA